jgi:nucleoside-diphosphate-sugar epimerase
MKNSGTKNVLITGIRGFVGSNLTKYLLRDDLFQISGVSRNKERIEYLQPILKHTFSIEDIYKHNAHFDAYVHLSGKVYDVRDKGNEQEYFEANYEATKRLFNQFINDTEAERFIFLSTIHVLTESPEEELNESYKPQPFTPYGKSKYKAENYIRNHCPPDKKYYILRPSMIHGPGNKGNLNLLYNLVKRGIPYPVGAYNNKRSFVSIENLCFVIRELILNDVEGGLYHIADDEPTYTHDLVRLIAEATNKKGRIWNVNPKFLELIASFGDIAPIPLNSHRLKKLTGDFVVSNKKLNRAIGKPLPVKSEDGLKYTLNHL